MSELEQTEMFPTPEGTSEAAMEKLLAVAGPSFDAEQREMLKAKLAKLAKSEEKTTSGSEAPAAPQRLLTGKDVDWSEYDLNYNIAHLYKRAVQRETPQGLKWVAMVVDFQSTTKDFRNYGKKVNSPGAVDKTDVEALNVGEYLNDMVNGRDEWRIEAALPAMSGQVGLILTRQVPIVLPDPLPLKTEEEVVPPTDPQLKSVEDAALAFVEGQAGKISVDNGEEVRENTTGEDIGLRAIEKGSAEHEAALAQLDGKGSVEARTSGAAVLKALEDAAPTTLAAPQADLETPEPVENPLLGGAKVPAAGYSAAADLLRALADPNFRANLQQEE